MAATRATDRIVPCRSPPQRAIFLEARSISSLAAAATLRAEGGAPTV